MKRNELKQQLERELPYSRLTIRADRRIDEILSVLPDRDSRSLENALIPEDWQGFSAHGIQVPAEPEKRRPFVTAFKWAGACAAVLLVCLIALNFTAPSLAEQLPGVGGLFQTVNGWFQNREQEVAPPNEIDFLSLPVEDNGVELLSLEAGEGSITAAAQVPFMGRESYSFQDYYNGTPFGTYAVLWVGDQLFLPTETTIEGEEQAEVAEGFRGSFVGFDEPKTVTWSFLGLPEFSQQTVTLAVLEKDWNAETYEGKPLNRVIAEFALDTASLRAAATQRYEAGYPGCDPMKKPAPEEILNTQRNAWCISDWYSLAPYAVPESTIFDYYRHKAYCKAEFFQRNVDTTPVKVGDEFYQPPEWDSVTLKCFVDGYYKGSITTRSRSQLEEAFGQDFSVSDGGFMDVLLGNQKWYETEEGAFCDLESYGPERCRDLIFGIPATLLGCEDSQEALEAFLKEHEVRLALVDAHTEDTWIADAQFLSDVEREEELEAYRSLCAVNTPEPRFSALPVEDNGTVITAVYWEDKDDSSQLVIEGEVPFMGRNSYNLLDAYETMPLGVNGSIHGWANGWFDDGLAYVEGCDPGIRAGDNNFNEEPLPDPFPVTWRFDAPEGEADRTGRIVFALAEYETWLFKYETWGEYADPASKTIYDRVTAAFTIDLDTLEAAPSTDEEIKYCYGQPLTKVTPEEARETALNYNRPFIEGWYTEKPCVRWQENGGENGYRLVFYGPEDNTDLLSLNCYVDGESVKRACSYSRAELNEMYPGRFTVGDGAFMKESIGNAKWYGVDGYSYMDMNRSSGDSGFDFTERFGRNYRRVVFFIPASALNLDDDPEQLENLLADGRVGFELTAGPDNLLVFGDVAQAAEQERQESTEAYRLRCKGLALDIATDRIRLYSTPQPQFSPEPDVPSSPEGVSESQPEEETPAPYPDKLFIDPTPQPQPTPEPDRSEQPEA